MNEGLFKELFGKLLKLASHDNVRGNEAMTIRNLVEPLFRELGYQTNDPEEWLLESPADPYTAKKGKKKTADIMICIDGQTQIIIEAKAAGVNLDGFEGQLKEYYQEYPEVKLGVLTNGVDYRFYTDDLEKLNLMDREPFYEFSLHADKEDTMALLLQLKRDVLRDTDLKSLAFDQRFRNALTQVIDEHFAKKSKVSEKLVRWILARVKEKGFPFGNISPKHIDKYRETIFHALVMRFSAIHNVASGQLRAVPEGNNVFIHPTAQEASTSPTIVSYISGIQEHLDYIKDSGVKEALDYLLSEVGSWDEGAFEAYGVKSYIGLRGKGTWKVFGSVHTRQNYFLLYIYNYDGPKLKGICHKISSKVDLMPVVGNLKIAAENLLKLMELNPKKFAVISNARQT